MAKRPPPTFKCPKCEKLFFGPSGLKIHMQEKHAMADEKDTKALLKCPKCDKTFHKKTGLGSHLRSAHHIVGQSKTALEARTKSSRPFKCDQCPRMFKTAAGLAGHKITHLEVPTPTTQAIQPSMFNAPVPISSTPSDLTCPECGFVAKTEGGLATHRSVKHGVLGVFSQKHDAHSTSTDHIDTRDIQGPPYHCPECKAAGVPDDDNIFPSRPHLGRHRRFTHRVAGRITRNLMEQAGEAEVPPRVNPYAEGGVLSTDGARGPRGPYKKRGRPLGSRNQSTSTSLQLERTPLPNAITHNADDHQTTAHTLTYSLDPITIAHTAGSLETHCRLTAEKLGVPTSVFTRECAALFYHATRR